jgi:hypothetical protein
MEEDFLCLVWLTSRSAVLEGVLITRNKRLMKEGLLVAPFGVLGSPSALLLASSRSRLRSGV